MRFLLIILIGRSVSRIRITPPGVRVNGDEGEEYVFFNFFFFYIWFSSCACVFFILFFIFSRSVFFFIFSGRSGCVFIGLTGRGRCFVVDKSLTADRFCSLGTRAIYPWQQERGKNRTYEKKGCGILINCSPTHPVGESYTTNTHTRVVMMGWLAGSVVIAVVVVRIFRTISEREQQMAADPRTKIRNFFRFPLQRFMQNYYYY